MRADWMSSITFSVLGLTWLVLQVVQDTVTDAVQEAVAAAFEENGRFDVRANFYTLIAITGVVLYWRGIWNSW